MRMVKAYRPTSHDVRCAYSWAEGQRHCDAKGVDPVSKNGSVKV